MKARKNVKGNIFDRVHKFEDFISHAKQSQTKQNFMHVTANSSQWL